MKSLALTCGDINGIGPEIIIKSLNRIHTELEDELIVIIPESIFKKGTELVKSDFDYSIFDITGEVSKGIKIFPINEYLFNIGKPTRESGLAAYEALDTAIKLVESGRADGIVTAPLSKEAFALAGVKYNGHTKLLADRSNTKNYMMTFISDTFKTGLATIHVPIKDVDRLITLDLIRDKLNVAINMLKNDFGIRKPNIAVLGLNPHAGENGNIGRKEIDVIEPAIKEMNSKSANVEGTFVPDAFFATKNYLNFDFVLGMYHDQALIPFKMINFNSGVNFTAGLPLVRTSPDHGTAYDIAWKGVADEMSFLQSISWAVKILKKRDGEG
jgi:4-hydroxythreonine-4-phosphate dehydrogenase